MKKIIILLLFLIPLKVHAISASSYIVYDSNSNETLLGNYVNNQRLIASTSKIMTAIVAIENKKLNTTIKANNDILKAVGSSIYIEIGETITLKDLLYGLLMRSGNDAAVLIADLVSENEENFTKLMNEKAQELNMTKTHFYNSSGLENEDGNGNISTAKDMAILTTYAMKNKTFRKIFKTKSYTAKTDKKTYNWTSKNKLLKYDFITGGKTGFTIKARRTLVTTGKINNIDLVIVTMNDSNDWEDHLTLYEVVKNKYSNVKIIDKNKLDIDDYYIKNDVYKTLKKEDIKKLKTKYYVSKNDAQITVYLNEEIIYNQKLIKKEKETNFWNNLINELKTIFGGNK